MLAALYYAFLTYGFPVVEVLYVMSFLVCCRRRRPSKVRFAPSKGLKKSTVAQKKSNATQAIARSQLQKKSKSNARQLVATAKSNQLKSLLKTEVADNGQKSSIKEVQKKKTKGSYVDMLIPALENSENDVDVSAMSAVDKDKKCGNMEDSLKGM